MLRGNTIKRLGIILLVVLNIGCDQISKKMVRHHVGHDEYIELIDGHFILTKVENTGAMLGFGRDLSPTLKVIFLQAIPVAVLLILLYRMLRKTNMEPWLIFAFACVIGGGIGNLIDRIAHGSVTDFFQIKLGWLSTGIFNLADVSITVGVLLLLYLSFRPKKLAL